MGILDNIKVLTGEKPLTSPSVKKTVLIVEDEKPLLSVLTDRFENEGYKVLQATNGQEGLDTAIAQKPNIIILDLLMPIMDGKAMLHKLRDIPEFKALPVIVLTNAGDVENIRATKTLNNAVSFLIKSNVTMDQIVEQVKLVIG